MRIASRLAANFPANSVKSDVPRSPESYLERIRSIVMKYPVSTEELPLENDLVQMEALPHERCPHPRLLNALYRRLMGLTGRHGMRTLSQLNVRLFPNGQQIQLDTGLRLFLPPDPHFFGYLLGHEPHITAVFQEVIREGDVCLDVGANIGYFALMMAGCCGRTGTVYAFEAERENYDILRKNVAYACQRDFKIVAVRAAVSSNEGVLQLIPGAYSTHHRVASAPQASGKGGKTVPSVTLPAELKRQGEYRRIRMMKVDVEGHEASVLEGCAPWLAEGRVEHFIIEVRPGDQARRIDEQLRPLGGQIRYWLDDAWREVGPEHLSSRTDAWVALA